ncbi:MAG: hypothetical protein V3U13_09805, partial [Gemmatimonadota bacterium]
IGFAFGTTNDGHPNWNKMNAALDTSREKWEGLTSWGTWARHLDPATAGRFSRPERAAVLDLARDAIGLFIAHLRRVGLD